ncbi:MAG: hypothetical protein LRS41_02705 [Caldisphaeraceae archaeon]|nr:hypothetical protein [Caldisphaeraceae archaeon]
MTAGKRLNAWEKPIRRKMGMVTPPFSCANESKVTIRGLRPSLIFSKAGQAISISAALNEPLTKMRFMEKPLHGYQSYKNNENII